MPLVEEKHRQSERRSVGGEPETPEAIESFIASLEAKRKLAEEAKDEAERKRNEDLAAGRINLVELKENLEREKAELERAVEEERKNRERKKIRRIERNSPEYKERQRIRRLKREQERELERESIRKTEIEFIQKKLGLGINNEDNNNGKAVNLDKIDDEDAFGTWTDWSVPGGVPKLIETPPTPPSGRVRAGPIVHCEGKDFGQGVTPLVLVTPT